MKTWIVVILLAATFADTAFPAKDQVPMDRTFAASSERVYAATVQAVGSTLKSAVKEACTVNFVSSDTYTTWAGTAVCQERGNGTTLVTLSLQNLSSASRQKFFLGGARDKVAKAFWSNVDAAVRASGSAIGSGGQVAATRPTENLGTVTVTSKPDGAEITVDGKFSGNCPATLRLSPGDHAITISSKGLRNWERAVTVTAGGATTINATLEQ